MKKRILIFSTAYFPLVGGAEVAVKEITDRLPEYEFVMLTAKIKLELATVERVGAIEVHRIGSGSHWDKFRLIWNGRTEAQKLGKFDAVWSIMASYAGLSALRYKKQNPGVPFLLTLQEGDSKTHIYKHVWWCWPYWKQIFKRADRIQAISNYLADWAKNLGTASPIEVVPNGVAVEQFKKTNAAAANHENTKNIITTSRLVAKNGVADLIQAMRFLPAEIHLKIAGSGPLESNLKELAHKFQLESRVEFLGELNHHQLPARLWASNVFCRPSLSEGLGVSFLEAMAAEVPIVATDVGGIPDFLKDGETGLFCKVGDPEDIAHQIKRILDDQALAEKLKANSQKLVREKYSWDTVAVQIKNIFEKL